jgi:hypothetical protein
MLAFFEESRLVDDQHGLRIAQMFDQGGLQIIPDLLSIPLRASQQMLDPVRGPLSVDFGDLPAVFPLYWAEEAPERGPSTPPGFAPRKPYPNPPLHLGQPQRPGAHRIEAHVAWEYVLSLPQLHGSVLRKRFGTIITY